MGKYLKYLIWLFVIGSFTPLTAQVIHPLYHGPFSFDYELLYHKGIAFQDFDYLPAIGPFFTNQSCFALSQNATPAIKIFRLKASQKYRDNLRLYTIATERYLTEKSKGGDDLPHIISGFAYQPGQHFGALAFFNLDRAKAIDPDYAGKKYRGLAGEIETAALLFKKGRIAAAIGRMRIFWGQQRHNLSLSENMPPLDMLTASYNTGRLSFSFLFAGLDGSRPDSADLEKFPDRSFNDNRYLVAHRLDFKIHRRFRIGLFETVLFGGEGRSPELMYLNPLQFFHSAQLNNNSDDNTMVGLDFAALPGYQTTIYGQLLIDDFQIDKKEPGDQEPDEIGLMLGIFKAGKIGALLPDIKAEYVRITNRTCHQADPKNRYLFRNKIIGHTLGPDADSLSLKLRFWPNNLFFCEIEAAYRRHGEGSIYNSWDEPWLNTENDYDEPFPTGMVEKSTLLAFRANGYLPFTEYTRNHFFFTLDAGWGDIKNYGNLSGENKTTSRLDISLTWLGYIDFNLAD